MNRLIKTQQELEVYQKEVRNRQYKTNPVTAEFGDGFESIEPYDFDTEYIRVTKVDNHEIIERVKYER